MRRFGARELVVLAVTAPLTFGCGDDSSRNEHATALLPNACVRAGGRAVLWPRAYFAYESYYCLEERSYWSCNDRPDPDDHCDGRSGWAEVHEDVPYRIRAIRCERCSATSVDDRGTQGIEVTTSEGATMARVTIDIELVGDDIHDNLTATTSADVHFEPDGVCDPALLSQPPAPPVERR